MTQTGKVTWGFCDLGEVPGLRGLLQGGKSLLAPLWASAQVGLSLGRAGAQSSSYPKQKSRFVPEGRSQQKWFTWTQTAWERIQKCSEVRWEVSILSGLGGELTGGVG